MDSKADVTETSHLFPDLHLKMSKKIAQLTRVIYQLHSRNQDGKDEMDAITKKHENDVREIMEDAASKINEFKAKLEKRKEEAKNVQSFKTIQERYEKEKERARTQLIEFKARVEKRKQETHRTMQARMTLLQQKVSEARSGFEVKLKIENEEKEVLKRKLRSAALETERLKTEWEESDARYHANMKAANEAHSACKQQLEAEITSLREKLSQAEDARKEAAALARKKASESTEIHEKKEKELVEVRSSLCGKIEDLLADNESLRQKEEENMKRIEELEHANEALREEIEDVRKYTYFEKKRKMPTLR